MNEKQLNQIEEWIAGKRRYKLLDLDRKDILKLKGARLQVWMAQWMSESDEGEAWLSLTTLMNLTGLAEHTVIEARRWLVANGCMKEPGGTAADKYKKPTVGAHKVKVRSVKAPPANNAGVLLQNLHLQNLQPPAKHADKVYVSGSDFASGCSSVSGCDYDYTPSSVGREDKDSSLREEEQATTKPRAKTPACSVRDEAKPVESKLKRSLNYDESFPLEFDSWSVESRAEWVEQHRVSRSSSSATPTPPLSTPPPPPASTVPRVSTVPASVPAWPGTSRRSTRS